MKENGRYARFQQIKQTVKEAQDYLLVGVDVAKDIQHAWFHAFIGKNAE